MARRIEGIEPGYRGTRGMGSNYWKSKNSDANAMYCEANKKEENPGPRGGKGDLGF